MSCPTCDHTMEGLGQNDRADNIFLCPRCGTVKIDAFGQHGDKVYVPKLVERCRKFIGVIGANFVHGSKEASAALPAIETEWYRVGIAESINTPKDRPT